MYKLQVGQQLWHVPPIGARGASFVTVAKVGRKWADLSNEYRVDLATLFIEQDDRRNYQGRCYLKREDWVVEIYRQSLWRGLSGRLWDRPLPMEGVTAQDIQEAARLLGIDLSDVSPPAEQGVTDAG